MFLRGRSYFFTELRVLAGGTYPLTGIRTRSIRLPLNVVSVSSKFFRWSQDFSYETFCLMNMQRREVDCVEYECVWDLRASRTATPSPRQVLTAQSLTMDWSWTALLLVAVATGKRLSSLWV